MQNSGAQRGFFLVPEAATSGNKQRLFVEAAGEVGSEVVSERVGIQY